jgi:ribokinase
VVAVDTTGAGDEFAGRLAADLAQGVDLFRAGENAAAAAARLVSVARDRR